MAGFRRQPRLHGFLNFEWNRKLFTVWFVWFIGHYTCWLVHKFQNWLSKMSIMPHAMLSFSLSLFPSHKHALGVHASPCARTHLSLSLRPPPPPPPYHYYFLCRFAGKERALSLPVSDKKNFEGYQGHQNYKFHKNKLLRISLRVCCWYENKKYVVLSFETELFDLWKKRLPLLVSVQ